MKLAKYRSLDVTGIEIVLQVTHKPDVPGYQRLSEVIEVEFPPIGGDDVAQQIEAIDVARRVIEKKYDAELARLDDRKAELQAMNEVAA
jgi:hypothetical protein